MHNRHGFNVDQIGVCQMKVEYYIEKLVPCSRVIPLSSGKIGNFGTNIDNGASSATRIHALLVLMETDQFSYYSQQRWKASNVYKKNI